MKVRLLTASVAMLAGLAAAPAANAHVWHRHYLALAAPPAYAAIVPHGPYAAYAARGPHLYVSGRAYPDPFAFPRGISYGTGYHGAGSITGGPAGGLPNRN